jgi:hypothetical protein
MNGRFVLDFYATPATKSARPTLAEYRHRIPDVEAQTVHCGQDTFQTDLADTAIDVVIMMTNDRPSRIRRDPSTHHSMRGRIRKLLRSTGLVVALSSFLLLPMPVTGIVFDPAAYADPYSPPRRKRPGESSLVERADHPLRRCRFGTKAKPPSFL